MGRWRLLTDSELSSEEVDRWSVLLFALLSHTKETQRNPEKSPRGDVMQSQLPKQEVALPSLETPPNPTIIDAQFGRLPHKGAAMILKQRD